jgi:hypothetical protein
LRLRPARSRACIICSAGNHVGFLPAELRKPLGEEIDGLAHRHLHRFFEVWVEAHNNPMSGILGARPADLHVLTHDELEFSAEPGLDLGPEAPSHSADGRERQRIRGFGCAASIDPLLHSHCEAKIDFGIIPWMP